ncbi:MAG: amino acid permease [Atopobiaceae bacterium]|nr:amino acid permease [Atopobiaceae bacterium]MCH4181150.1 amino acid permease [Atopobiaceae bacterium]MCH4214808.1 amino acid permease [Atopobiaceae bacterium]MCH4276804.1 amino acid permease [Atopobiaceae bacterium]MCI1259583.1 amino acid permease [Atopobiaceae bacterium]
MSVPQIAIMTTISVASLRSLPAMAENGLSSVIMYLVPAFLFLLPTALVAAELATTFKGGIYVWVREAFGERLGFVSIWLQWIQNVVWFPIQLAFIAAALAFMLGDDSLSNSGLYTGVIIIVVYWLATLVALKGGDLFAKLGSWGGLIGTLIPAGLLIVLGAVWVATAQPITQSFTQSTWLSPGVTSVGSVVLIISNVLAYAGMEMNAVHAGDMRNPRKDYPKAIVIALVLILVVFIVPTLAISIAVPADKIGMSNGINVAFQTFFDQFGIGWASNVVAGAIVFGALASVITWVAGPSKGLLIAARGGLLPPVLQRRNKHGVQVGILMVQGIIVTLLALIYVIVPNVSSVFMALIDMAAALYIIMYVIMFAAVLVLRRKAADVRRGYKVPALGLVAGIGIIACVIGLVISFVPSSSDTGIPDMVYPIVVALVVIVLGTPPLVFYAARRPSWDQRSDAEKAEDANPLHDEVNEGPQTAGRQPSHIRS